MSCLILVAVLIALFAHVLTAGTRVPRTELTEMGPALDLEASAGCSRLLLDAN